jgi:glutamate-1-semialdehyde 2,1-aminomutase
MKTIDSIVSTYIKQTPKSKTFFEHAKRIEPGGVTRSVAYYPPYPIYISRGEGCYIYDLDGNERIDFLNNYSSMILGHAHPKVLSAVAHRLSDGTAYSYSNELEIQLAEMICKRVPSLDKIRFTNSGMEATMFAIRAACAFTGKEKIAKFEGGYHGTTDLVQMSVKPPIEKAGPPDAPLTVPEAQGIPHNLAENVVILPFNDAENTEALINKYKDELAAIIVEPFLGSGQIPAIEEYLKFLREITRQYHIILIFDEVQSLRLAPGGAQEFFHVIPDMTALGKIIGGGFPVGAFGGSADIMEVFEPRANIAGRFDPIYTGAKIYQGGTFTGNPITMIAGITTLEELTPEIYEQLNEMGHSLRSRLNDLFRKRNVKAMVTGVGSMANFHCTTEDVMDFRSYSKDDQKELYKIFLSLMNHGILIAPRGMISLSTPMTEKEIDAFLAAMVACLD